MSTSEPPAKIISPIFADISLRDGLQAPGCNPLTVEERLTFAKKVIGMGVHVVEAGFAGATTLDFEVISKISNIKTNCIISSLARCHINDITAAGEALKNAKNKRIHVFISTSPIHMAAKLAMTSDEVLEAAVDGVKMALQYTDDVQFSLEDFTRTEESFAHKVIAAVIDAGATTVNLPDTVGYTTPTEYAGMISRILQNVPTAKNITLSTHCHDDLGLAVANSIAAVEAGALQIECTINGLGERAGNAALEELAMVFKVREDHFNSRINLDTTRLTDISQYFAEVTGIPTAHNKAIVGLNAFRHESGIHVHGIGKNPQTYEIMTAESVGCVKSSLTIGALSGRSGLHQHAAELGFTLSKEQVNELYDIFMEVAEKERVSDDEFIKLIKQVQGETKVIAS